MKACTYCTLPAVCFGANLARPHYRCPIHCREHPQLGGQHGDDDYMAGHLPAEGLTL